MVEINPTGSIDYYSELINDLNEETDELIRIFVSSLETVQKKIK